jgi:hypothetical protein
LTAIAVRPCQRGIDELGLVLLALTYWPSGKFSIELFDVTLSGPTWCVDGCAFGVWWGTQAAPRGRRSSAAAPDGEMMTHFRMEAYNGR